MFKSRDYLFMRCKAELQVHILKNYEKVNYNIEVQYIIEYWTKYKKLTLYFPPSPKTNHALQLVFAYSALIFFTYFVNVITFTLTHFRCPTTVPHHLCTNVSYLPPSLTYISINIIYNYVLQILYLEQVEVFNMYTVFVTHQKHVQHIHLPYLQFLMSMKRKINIIVIRELNGKEIRS